MENNEIISDIITKLLTNKQFINSVIEEIKKTKDNESLLIREEERLYSIGKKCNNGTKPNPKLHHPSITTGTTNNLTQTK